MAQKVKGCAYSSSKAQPLSEYLNLVPTLLLAPVPDSYRPTNTENVSDTWINQKSH